MAELLGSFDPSKVICTIGPVVISGWSDGDFLTAARDEDLYFKRVGADGGVSRARNSNKSGTIEVRTLSTSGANDLITALFALDNLSEDGKVVVPMAIADLSGRTLVAASQGWLRTLPPAVFSKEPSECVWVFDCADMSMFIGGNPV